MIVSHSERWWDVMAQTVHKNECVQCFYISDGHPDHIESLSHSSISLVSALQLLPKVNGTVRNVWPNVAPRHQTNLTGEVGMYTLIPPWPP